MSKAGLVSMIAARLCSVPHRIYHNHGMAAFSATGIKRALLGLVERITCRLASTIIFCGNSTLEKATSLKYCSAAKAVVIGQGTISGININRFQKNNNTAFKTNSLRKYGLNEQTFTIGFVGRIVPHKGIDTIIEAWPLVQKHINQDSQLVLAGGNNNDNLYKKLSTLASIHHNGHIDFTQLARRISIQRTRSSKCWRSSRSYRCARKY